jgi:putative transposase
MISASDRAYAIELIDEAVNSGARLRIACEELSLNVRTYYRWVKLARDNGNVGDLRPTAKRPEPANKLSDEERTKIIQTVNKPEYASMPPSQIVPSLADKGIYLASESTFYRVLREHNMQHHRGHASDRNPRPLSTHCATEPNQVWTWDITYLSGPIKGTYFYLYMISDLFDRSIVGWEVWPEQSAKNSSDLIKRTIIAQGIKPPLKAPLVLHSDNGSPMKGATMLETLYKLGLTPSNSRPRVSNDNPYVESLFKTIKYHCSYPANGFKSIGDARDWCSRFVKWYNNEHHHSGLKFLTPAQRRNPFWREHLANRKKVYEEAKKRHPERWNGRDTRDWTLPAKVWLNPEKDKLDKNLLENTQCSA